MTYAPAPNQIERRVFQDSAEAKRVLLVDIDGNPVSIVVSTPSWQAVTDVGNTTTNHLRIGSSAAPTAWLDFAPAALDGALGNAPIRFGTGSGTLLAAPLAGTIEWDGTDLYYTKASGPTRLKVVNTAMQAAADGATLGIAAFTAADFNSSSGVISLDYANGQKATGSQSGFLLSTDWTTFNNKFNLPSLTSGSVLFSNGTTIAQDNANFFWDDSLNRLGLGTNSPGMRLVVGAGAGTQETLRINAGNANKAAVLSVFNAGNSEGFVAQDTATMLLGINPAGYSDAQLQAAARLAIYSDGSLQIGKNQQWSILELGALGGANSLDFTANSYINSVLHLEHSAGGGRVGMNTSNPRKRLDVLDTSGAQVRLTYTDNSVYTDLQTTSSGYFYVNPSGGRIGLFTSSPTGFFHLAGGTSPSGNALDANFVGQVAAAGNNTGGSFNFTPGAGTGSGASGTFNITGRLIVGNASAIDLGATGLNVFTNVVGTAAAIQCNAPQEGGSILVMNGAAGVSTLNGVLANLSTTAHAIFGIQQNGTGTARLDALTTSTGDALTVYSVNGVTSWGTGLDNSDSDNYKISCSSVLGTNDALTAYTSDCTISLRQRPRVISMADATSCTPTGDTADVNYQTNTQAAGTLTVNAPSGTPNDGQVLKLRLKCTNAQTLSFDGIYRGGTTVALPAATTGSSKEDYLVFMYNSGASKWDIQVSNLGY